MIDTIITEARGMLYNAIGQMEWALGKLEYWRRLYPCIGSSIIGQRIPKPKSNYSRFHDIFRDPAAPCREASHCRELDAQNTSRLPTIQQRLLSWTLLPVMKLLWASRGRTPRLPSQARTPEYQNLKTMAP